MSWAGLGGTPKGPPSPLRLPWLCLPTGLAPVPRCHPAAGTGSGTCTVPPNRAPVPMCHLTAGMWSGTHTMPLDGRWSPGVTLLLAHGWGHSPVAGQRGGDSIQDPWVSEPPGTHGRGDTPRTGQGQEPPAGIGPPPHPPNIPLDSGSAPSCAALGTRGRPRSGRGLPVALGTLVSPPPSRLPPPPSRPPKSLQNPIVSPQTAEGTPLGPGPPQTRGWWRGSLGTARPACTYLYRMGAPLPHCCCPAALVNKPPRGTLGPCVKCFWSQPGEGRGYPEGGLALLGRCSCARMATPGCSTCAPVCRWARR